MCSLENMSRRGRGCGGVYDGGNPACQCQPRRNAAGEVIGWSRCPDISCRTKGEREAGKV